MVVDFVQGDVDLRGGDVSSLGLEAVLVGYVGDGVGHSVGSDVRELSPGHDRLVLLALVHDLSLFAGGDAVAGFVPGREPVE